MLRNCLRNLRLRPRQCGQVSLVHAGPDGGSEQKPVGTVVFARAKRYAEDREAESKVFQAEDRSEVRRQATLCALELLLP